jgi:hypothetical protein
MEREETDVVQELATSLAPAGRQWLIPLPLLFSLGEKGVDGRTDVPRVEEREDGADGKDVVELVEDHLVSGDEGKSDLFVGLSSTGS